MSHDSFKGRQTGHRMQLVGGKQSYSLWLLNVGALTYFPGHSMYLLQEDEETRLNAPVKIVPVSRGNMIT